MRSKRHLPWITQAAIYVGAMQLVHFGVRAVFSDSPANLAYAEISSWWCGLFVAYVLRISVQSAVKMVPLVALIDYIAVSLGLRNYHDAPDGLVLALLVLMRAVTEVSPIVVAVAAKAVLMRLRLIDQ
jgi:hypothetical protein